MTKTVCVIGAGAAGLAAARHSLDAGLQVDVYEQTGQVGGTWVYAEERGCHSSMYHFLKTNLPKEVMQFKDVPFPEDLPSFIEHQDVLEYLENYSKDLPIHFNHTVENVKRVDGKWQVTVQSGDGEKQKDYDIVFVCNGHYFQPNNPFENSKFKGFLIHSHDYRKAEEFRDQTVLIIGAGPSGIDIALQLAETAKKVVLISRKATYPKLPANIEQVPYHVQELTESGCLTEKGAEIQADSIIVCTGYFYKFPFLGDELLTLKEHDQLVSPVFEHVVHVNYPESLFFIGLNLVTITFPLFEYQIELCLSYALGRAPIPSRQTLLNFETAHIEHQKARGLDAKFYHLLQAEQWEYLRRLAKLGNFETWPFMDVIERMTTYLQEQRKINVIGYKNINFVLSEDNTQFDVVKKL